MNLCISQTVSLCRQQFSWWRLEFSFCYYGDSAWPIIGNGGNAYYTYFTFLHNFSHLYVLPSFYLLSCHSCYPSFIFLVLFFRSTILSIPYLLCFLRIPYSSCLFGTSSLRILGTENLLVWVPFSYRSNSWRHFVLSLWRSDGDPVCHRPWKELEITWSTCGIAQSA